MRGRREIKIRPQRLTLDAPYYGHFQIELIQFSFCALLPTINNSLNAFLVESQSLDTNREQIQTNHCTHRARHDSPFAEGRNFCSAAPDTLGGAGGLQQVTRKKAVALLQSPWHSHTYWRGGKVKCPRLSGAGGGSEEQRNTCAPLLLKITTAFVLLQCSTLQRDQRSRIMWKGKRLVQKKGSEEWWRSSMSCVWTLQICCSTSYCFIFLIYHR